MSIAASDESRAKDPFTARVEGSRHAVYAGFSEAAPITRLTLPSGALAWFVTGHAETRALLTDPRISKVGPEHAPFAQQMPADLADGINQHMLYADPPDHTRLRRLVTMAFTRRRVEGMAPRIQRLTDDLLDALDRPGGPDVVDLIPTLAYPLPIAVIASLLGFPDDVRADFREWTEAIMAPDFAGYDAYADAVTKLLRFTREMIAAKRRVPSDDLLSDLIAVRDGGDRLTEDELTSMVYLLVIAGHETTANLIANGTLALLANPRQLALLRAEPERLESAIEEILRYDGPVQNTLPAVATATIETGDVTIAAGDVLFFALLAANRDPARFADPGRLDLDRGQITHTAFGHGVHHCLGAPLARLEARIVLGTLLDRFPGLALAVPSGDVTRKPSLIMHSLDALPVRLKG